MSGFVGNDYVFCFEVARDEVRARLEALCRGPWLGDEVLKNVWQIRKDMEPQEFEDELLAVLEPGDRAAYYYLSDLTNPKRIFRVDVLR